MGDGEGREHGPTGPSTNANPPDIPPERQGGPEQSGCGCRRGPTVSANEAHKGGYPDGGKDRRQAAQRDGGRIKQGDERCGRGWVFSEAHNKNWKHQTVSDFTPPRSDGRRGWRMKLHPPDRQRHSLPSLPGLGPGELSVLHQTSCFYLKWAGAVVIGITAFNFSWGHSSAGELRLCTAATWVRFPLAPPFS